MPPAAVHHILLQTLALLAAAAVAVRLHAGTGRTVIAHRGRLWPVVIASAVVALTLSVMLQPHALWIGAVAAVAFSVALGVMLQLSVRWDSFLSLLVQAAATWATFGLWMAGHDLVHAYATGAAFWQPWNSLIRETHLVAGLFFAILQATAIRGARTRARRPAATGSVAVAQRDRLRALHTA